MSSFGQKQVQILTVPVRLLVAPLLLVLLIVLGFCEKCDSFQVKQQQYQHQYQQLTNLKQQQPNIRFGCQQQHVQQRQQRHTNGNRIVISSSYPPSYKSSLTSLHIVPDFIGTSVLVSSSSDISDIISTLVLSVEQLYPTSPEPIHTAFTIATFLPQPFWLLMILVPNNKVTKIIMGGLEVPLLCCLIHFFIVTQSIAMDGTDVTAPLSEFNNVFDPNGNPQLAFMKMTTNYPNFVAEEWSHVLTWDLFIGRYIWIDGLKRNIFTPHSVLLSNLIGPPGLLLHWLTCTLFYNKPIFEPSEKDEIVNL